MNKAVSNFIAKEDLDSILIPNWNNAMKPENIEVAFETLVNLMNFDSPDKVKKNKYLEDMSISPCRLFHIEVEVAFVNNALKDKDMYLFYPIIDSFGVCRGYLASYDYLKYNLVMDSPMDYLTQNDWDVEFKIKEIGGPIYPYVGMVYYEDNPLKEHWMKEFYAAPSVPLGWFELSPIFKDLAPGRKTEEIDFYYAKLKEFGIFSSIQFLPFLMLKELGLLKSSVRFQDYHKLVSQSYIEF